MNSKLKIILQYSCPAIFSVKLEALNLPLHGVFLLNFQRERCINCLTVESPSKSFIFSKLRHFFYQFDTALNVSLKIVVAKLHLINGSNCINKNLLQPFFQYRPLCAEEMPVL